MVLTGPAVLELSHHHWYELTCSFSHEEQEMDQLDIKVKHKIIIPDLLKSFQWYFGEGDSPFLQWVPGSGQTPQTVDNNNKFKQRLQVIARTIL